jgi:7,8-dihydropterin-6-yl-methyl-4-(beta-D-ribofuranosyl)aminobenzene 5'-phosphate synthase
MRDTAGERRKMEIKITTLTENTATQGFLAEWGLSILVQVDGLNILLDTGAGSTVVHNAQLLGIDLSSIDYVVLSHGHADHTGGLREVLRIKGDVKVIGHPDIWAPKYARRDNQKEKYIGIPFQRDELENLGARFKLSRKPVRITDKIMTTGEVPMVSGFEAIEDNLLVKQKDAFFPDPLADDLSLVINTDFGLVVITGCAHRGIINNLLHARKLTGEDIVYAAIGGTHLFRAPGERTDRTIEMLLEMGVQKLGVSHCTGFQASAHLAQAFGDIFFLNNAGTQMKLPSSISPRVANDL